MGHGYQLVIPAVAAGLDIAFGRRDVAAYDHDVPDRGRVLQRLVGHALERDKRGAPVTPITG